MILSCTLILPILQLQIQQLMSQIIHIKYLIQTCNIPLLILQSKLIKKSSLTDGFNKN